MHAQSGAADVVVYNVETCLLFRSTRMSRIFSARFEVQICVGFAIAGYQCSMGSRRANESCGRFA